MGFIIPGKILAISSSLEHLMILIALTDIKTVIDAADVEDEFLRVLDVPIDIRPVAGAVVRGQQAGEPSQAEQPQK